MKVTSPESPRQPKTQNQNAAQISGRIQVKQDIYLNMYYIVEALKVQFVCGSWMICIHQTTKCSQITEHNMVQ